MYVESFKSKIKITGKAPTASNAKDVERAVPLKYLNNLCKTLEVPLNNYEINLVKCKDITRIEIGF